MPSDKCACCREMAARPDVWCGKDADSVKSFDVDYKLLSPDVFSADSGPDVGIQEVRSKYSSNENNNAINSK